MLLGGEHIACDFLLVRGSRQIQRRLQLFLRPLWDSDALVQFGHSQVSVKVSRLESDRGFQRPLGCWYVKRLGQRDAECQMPKKRLGINLHRLAQENDSLIDVVTLQCIDPAHQK